MRPMLPMAWLKSGASEGKPMLFTQALGIPLVALVFWGLRSLVLGEVAVEVPDFLLVSACVWVYTIDFFMDSLRWDELGWGMRPWQVGWVLFWGLLPFLGLLLVAPLAFWLRSTVFSQCYHWIHSLRFVILGGFSYLLVSGLSKKWAATLRPVCIGITFDVALFYDQSLCFGSVLFWQGGCLFLLNVLLMQWFEQDKDRVSNSINVWLALPAVWLNFMMLLLTSLLLAFWLLYIDAQWGVLVVLLLYGTMLLWPNAYRHFRVYRLILDGALLLWLV